MKVPTMLSYSPNEQQLGSGPTPSRVHYLKRLPKPHIGLFVWALTGPMAASLWSYNSVGDPIVSALVGLSNCTFILPIISYILSTVLQSDFDLKRPTCLRFMEFFFFLFFFSVFSFHCALLWSQNDMSNICGFWILKAGTSRPLGVVKHVQQCLFWCLCPAVPNVKYRQKGHWSNWMIRRTMSTLNMGH